MDAEEGMTCWQLKSTGIKLKSRKLYIGGVVNRGEILNLLKKEIVE